MQERKGRVRVEGGVGGGEGFVGPRGGMGAVVVVVVGAQLLLWWLGNWGTAAGVGPRGGMGAVREVVAGVVVVVVPLVGVARLAVQLVARLVVQVPGEGGGGATGE